MQATSERELWYAVPVAGLATAFLIRVAGQAIQGRFPQEFLPTFAVWHGGGVSYPAPLACQIVIVGRLGVSICTKIHRIAVLGITASRSVIAIGCGYFAIVRARPALGLTAHSDSGWLTGWIPALPRLDLAAVVIPGSWRQHRLAVFADTG